MIYTYILIAHIALGIVSLLLAPVYLVSVITNSKFVNSLKNGMLTSIIGTVTLGAALIVVGAPLGRSCITLAVYSVAMVGVVLFGQAKTKRANVKI